MKLNAAWLAGLALVAFAAGARAQDDPHARFRQTMDNVFGAGAWRITGGYRTEARENELRAQGALTVPAGRISRHSQGTREAPGAYDVVVAGLTPWQAAARLRRAGASFRTIFPEGSHGTQGPHLHIDPYSHGWRGGGGLRVPPGLPWLVADPTPTQQMITGLRRAAEQGEVEAQLELAGVYAQGRLEPRNLIEAYVWAALAASNPAADAESQREGEEAARALAARMTPEQLLDARQFLVEPAAGARAYAPVVARRTAGQPIQVAGRGAAQVTLAAPAAACQPPAGAGLQASGCLRLAVGPAADTR